MGKPIRILLAAALLTAACGPAGTPPSSSTSKPPPTTTTTLDRDTGTSTTTSTIATTSTTVNNLSADDTIQSAKQSMGVATHLDGGRLADNGAFEESAEDVNPFGEIEVFHYVDEEGTVHIYLEGPAETLHLLSIEFDAVDDNRTVKAETSYKGRDARAPGWVETTAQGTLRDARVSPPPEGSGGMDPLGVLIPTDISTLEEFAQISIWLYRGLDGGGFDYSHFNILFEELLANTEDGVLAAAFFSGLLTPEGVNTDLAWVVLGQ